MLSLHRTSLTFVAQRTHQDVRHIARPITYHCTTVTYWRFKRACFRTSIFFMRTFIKQIANFFFLLLLLLYRVLLCKVILRSLCAVCAFFFQLCIFKDSWFIGVKRTEIWDMGKIITTGNIWGTFKL